MLCLSKIGEGISCVSVQCPVMVTGDLSMMYPSRCVCVLSCLLVYGAMAPGAHQQCGAQYAGPLNSDYSLP